MMDALRSLPVRFALLALGLAVLGATAIGSYVGWRGNQVVTNQALDAAVREIQHQWQQTTSALGRIGLVVLDTCFEGNAHLLLEDGARRLGEANGFGVVCYVD